MEAQAEVDRDGHGCENRPGDESAAGPDGEALTDPEGFPRGIVPCMPWERPAECRPAWFPDRFREVQMPGSKDLNRSVHRVRLAAILLSGSWGSCEPKVEGSLPSFADVTLGVSPW